MQTRITAFLAVLTIALVASSAPAATRTWNNSGTNFNTGASWGGTAPGSADRAAFNNAAVTQPKLSASIAILTLSFETAGAGYDITNTSTEVLTLSQNGAGGAVTTAAIFANNTSGTNTIDAPILLSNAANTSIAQNASGGTLVLNGVISSSSAISVNFIVNGASTLLINNANTYSGPTVLSGGTLASNPVVNIGNNGAFSSGAVSVAAGINIAAVNGSRTIANAVTLNASPIIAGAQNLTFSGDFTAAGAAATRTLTVNNTATTALTGNVYLSGASGTGVTWTINGSGATNISGPIANFNGAGTAGSLIYSGTNTLTLSGTNTFTGNTSVRGGGTISASTIGNSGANSNLGAGTTINFGSTTTGGTLLYTGSGETTNRIINLAGTTGGATIDQSGTGALVFTANVTDAGTAAVDNRKTLTLQGSTGGTGEISGNIVDSTAGTAGQTANSVAKAGSGTWTLSGTNTYTGTTGVTGGTLIVNGNQSAANGAVSVTTASTLGGIGTIGGAVTVGSATTAGTITGATSGTIGTLNLNSTAAFLGAASNLSTYSVDIGGLTSDKLAITGALDLSGVFDQISFNQLSTLTGTSYTLATYSGVTGTFDSVTALPTGYTLVYNPTELDLVITAVPEPSTWLAGALVFATLLVTQRRRFVRKAAVANI